MNRDQAEAYLWILMSQTRRYHFGGDDPIQGFDCSGLVHEFLMASGVCPHEVKPSAQQLFDRFSRFGLTNVLEPLPPHTLGWPFGALAFFGEGPAKVEHVAVVISSTHMIGAEGGDSGVTSDATAILRNAFVKVRPIAYRRNLIGFIMPEHPWL